jgi:hypothetical protein
MRQLNSRIYRPSAADQVLATIVAFIRPDIESFERFHQCVPTAVTIKSFQIEG